LLSALFRFLLQTKKDTYEGVNISLVHMAVRIDIKAMQKIRGLQRWTYRTTRVSMTIAPNEVAFINV
jgi:hypothetical protein